MQLLHATCDSIATGTGSRRVSFLIVISVRTVKWWNLDGTQSRILTTLYEHYMNMGVRRHLHIKVAHYVDQRGVVLPEIKKWTLRELNSLPHACNQFAKRARYHMCQVPMTLDLDTVHFLIDETKMAEVRPKRHVPFSFLLADSTRLFTCEIVDHQTTPYYPSKLPISFKIFWTMTGKAFFYTSNWQETYANSSLGHPDLQYNIATLDGQKYRQPTQRRMLGID